jgi:hypothetical protein
MKKRLGLTGILSVALVLGLVLVGCKGGGVGDSGGSGDEISVTITGIPEEYFGSTANVELFKNDFGGLVIADTKYMEGIYADNTFTITTSSVTAHPTSNGDWFEPNESYYIWLSFVGGDHGRSSNAIKFTSGSATVTFEEFNF